jgi:hypothetical protein
MLPEAATMAVYAMSTMGIMATMAAGRFSLSVLL